MSVVLEELNELKKLLKNSTLEDKLVPVYGDQDRKELLIEVQAKIIPDNIYRKWSILLPIYIELAREFSAHKILIFNEEDFVLGFMNTTQKYINIIFGNNITHPDREDDAMKYAEAYINTFLDLDSNQKLDELINELKSVNTKFISDELYKKWRGLFNTYLSLININESTDFLVKFYTCTKYNESLIFGFKENEEEANREGWRKYIVYSNQERIKDLEKFRSTYFIC